MKEDCSHVSESRVGAQGGGWSDGAFEVAATLGAAAAVGFGAAAAAAAEFGAAEAAFGSASVVVDMLL